MTLASEGRLAPKVPPALAAKMARRRWRHLLFASMILTSWHASADWPEAPTPRYQHSLVGDPADVKRPKPAVASLVLMGGGRFVPDAFRWMLSRSGGGNVVVIRAAGTDAYNDYLYALGSVSSVETLIIPTRDAAHDPFVVSRVRQADGLFIAGGNQGDYVRFWKDTPLEKAIHELALNNVPIAGFSAGLAILGEYAFTAESGSIRSATAMADPYDKAITLRRGFLALPDLKNVITDSHFDTRDRMGRLITFMSRLVGNSGTHSVRGIGVSAGTALVVENGWAERMGQGPVYFLEARTAPEVLRPSVPLTHRDILIQRLDDAGQFDMRRWIGKAPEIAQYSVSIVNGTWATE